MKLDVLIENLTELIAPIVDELGYELYHIEYVKENGEYYLRIYIDNETGITLEDCEKVSRPVSDILDVKDPITDSYYLEVSSPGLNRNLYSDKHLNRYIGSEVAIKLGKPIEGKKLLKGSLAGFTESEVNISVDGNEIGIPRDKIKAINLEGEL
jgi:ribosome maturation factor RimP